MQNASLTAAIEKMSSKIREHLGDNECTIYIYGSVALDDFQLGWSDIDILCLTEAPITSAVADELVDLRQTLLAKEPENKYFRSFEGGIVHKAEFLNEPACRAMYWGTSGQRITENYVLDSFSKKELLEHGLLLCGEDIRAQLKMPGYDELYEGVAFHYDTIRKYAVSVPRHIYSFGWLLDIARCIYTLRTGEVIAKTRAAEWALETGLCPVPEALERALQLRRAPLKYKNDASFMSYADILGNDIQRFADILETEIKNSRSF